MLEEQGDAGRFGQRADAGGGVDAAAQAAQDAAQLLGRTADGRGQRAEVQPVVAGLVESAVEGALGGRCLLYTSKQLGIRD